MAEQVKVDIKTIEAKLDKNEKLTADEEKFLMEQQPGPEGFQPPIPGPEEKDKEEPKVQTPEEIKAAQDKAATDKKAKDALISRAKAVNLPETATEEEIVAAEKPAAESNQVDMLKLEEMLAKPEGKEDFTGWTKREQAYYWRMRREQKRASQAEADRDAARFELIKVKKEKPAEEPIKEEEDPLKGKEEGDFLTVADSRKILAKIQKKEEPPKGTGSIIDLPFVQAYIASCDEKMAVEKADYEETMELTEEIINTNPAYQKAVAEALIQGKNPALKMYELIQADPEYAKLLPAAQTRVQARKAKKSDKKEEPKAKTAEELKKEADAAEAERKLKENADKPKTSGHAEGKDKIEGSDYTLEQITAMSDREFSKLPKKVREKYLELYG
jgi:hypothetical protein